MTDVYPGFNFRNFDDHNYDNVDTWAELGDCYLANPNYPPYYIMLDLWRVNTFAPDDKVSTDGIEYDGDHAYFGDPSAHTYHITLAAYNKDDLWYNPLTCDTVNYGW